MGLDRIGKYKVLGRIGEGGMGTVFRAHDPLLNRSVAVKTISAGAGTDPEFRARFLREAQAAARLNHPNVVTIFDFGEEAGISYMAMELLEGRDLKELLASGRLGTLHEKLAVVEQVCEGVAFAHSKGVVHRDLKPGNIHVQPSGRVKVLDFGLARLSASDMTRTGTVMGTPHYMSPEQVRGAHVDARSDVFSLGAVLYEVLSGKRPFGRGPAHEVLLRIQSEEPEPIEEAAPGTPAPLVHIVHRAMEKDPGRRFAHAGAMGEALRRARAAIAPEPGEADATRSSWDRGEDTLLMPAAHGSVEGSTALAPSRSLAETEIVSTGRSVPTVRGAATEAAPPRRRGLILAAGAVVLAAAGLSAWMATRRPPAPAPAGDEQVDILTEALVTGQVELAREDLESRRFDAAIERVRKALALSPRSAEAQEVLALAERRLAERDAAVSDARAALTRGDVEANARALARILDIDPSHPVVAELSGAVGLARARELADAARRELAASRRAAEQARASGSPPYVEGRRLETEGQALFGKAEYTIAAQRYTESKIAFDRARRDTEAAARVAAATPPPATVSTTAAATPFPSDATASKAPAVARVVPPTAPPTATPAPLPALPRDAAPAPQPVPAAPPASGTTVATGAPAATSAAAPSVSVSAPGGEAAVLQVIADYKRAIESQNVELFRSLKPDLTADEEKRLREAFKTVKSHQVGLSDPAVEMEGPRASVRVTRQDVVNGRPMKPQQQTFRLVRQGDAWRIQSIGQ